MPHKKTKKKKYTFSNDNNLDDLKLTDLSLELLAKILSETNYIDVENAARANKRLYQAATLLPNSYWRQQSQIYFGSSAQNSPQNSNNKDYFTKQHQLAYSNFNVKKRSFFLFKTKSNLNQITWRRFIKLNDLEALKKEKISLDDLCIPDNTGTDLIGYALHSDQPDILEYFYALAQEQVEGFELFCWAIRCNKQKEVHQILLDNPDYINKTRLEKSDKGEYAPLHYAVRYGHEGIAQYLLAHNAMVNTTYQPQFSAYECKLTALHIACIYGQLEMIKTLVENYRALPKIQYKKTEKKTFTCLDLACKYNHPAIIEYLINKCNQQDQEIINIPRNHKMQSLHLACKYNHVKAVKELLKNQDYVRQSLAYEISRTNNPMIKYLLLEQQLRVCITTLEQLQSQTPSTDLSKQKKIAKTLLDKLNERKLESIKRLQEKYSNLTKANTHPDAIRKIYQTLLELNLTKIWQELDEKQEISNDNQISQQTRPGV